RAGAPRARGVRRRRIRERQEILSRARTTRRVSRRSIHTADDRRGSAARRHFDTLPKSEKAQRSRVPARGHSRERALEHVEARPFGGNAARKRAGPATKPGVARSAKGGVPVRDERSATRNFARDSDARRDRTIRKRAPLRLLLGGPGGNQTASPRRDE